MSFHPNKSRKSMQYAIGLLGLLLGVAADLPTLKAEQAAPMECRWADGDITIDGKAEEDVWKGAQLVEGFVEAGWNEGSDIPKSPTSAKLMWDREYLYFYAEIEDDDLTAKGTRKDGADGNVDAFGIFLKPKTGKTGFYAFQANVRGGQLRTFYPQPDEKMPDLPKGSDAYSAQVKVILKGSLNAKGKDMGWSVEGKIPWLSFLPTGGRPDLNDAWSFAFVRFDQASGFDKMGLSSNVIFPDPANLHAHERYATLRFVGQPRTPEMPPYGLEKRVPFTTSKVTGTPEPPPPYCAVKAFPKLKIPYPMNVYHQPGSNLLLAISHVRNYAYTSVVRFEDNADVDKFETLLEADWMFWDIAFHPDFAKNGQIFISAKGPMSVESSKRKVRVTRYTMQTAAPYKLDSKSAKPIIDWLSDGHDGAAMAFGADGMLYLTSGDGTTDSDRNIVGQNLGVLQAKVLRLDVDHPDRGKAYGVPKDNPFVNTPGARPETWTYGMRNPWRMSFDRESGQMWVGQNGQDLWEQVYILEKGANYGWSVQEGSYPFLQGRKAGPTPILPPLLEHSHLDFRSLTGGLVYRGEKLPELHGTYIYGDYVTGRIWGARHDGKKVTFNEELTDTPYQITGFGTDSRGELLVTDFNTAEKGGFYYLEPTPKDSAPANFPKKLSEIGLFESVKGHIMQPGIIPYDVTAPVWHDGAHMERFLALPGDSKIGFTTWRGWNFSDGAVIVQSLALEMEEGNPASRRWIETRLLTKQGADWQGYSYLWNEEQTEATLVESTGADREFEIKVPKRDQEPETVRKQTWHYPSRSECMTCHTRAANYVLGLNVQQMNRDFSYSSGVTDNQLRTLNHLGILTEEWGRQTLESMGWAMRAKNKTEKEINDLLTLLEPRPMQGEIKPVSALVGKPEDYPRMVNPYDEKAGIDDRARSYLQANCSHCHIENGGGNSGFNLEFTTKLHEMKLVDEPPMHNTFGLPDACVVAAGHPERSVMFMRILHRSTGHMPPLGTLVPDSKGVDLLRDWMLQLQPVQKHRNRK